MTKGIQGTSIPDFDVAMGHCTDYLPNRDLPEWRKYRDRYAIFEENVDRPTRIPKIIHQIWLGGNIPNIYLDFVDNLKAVNSGMEYKFWNETNIDFELLSGDLIHKINNFGQKSDLLRYEILNKYGGVYLDMDFHAVSSFEPLLTLNFFAGIVYSPTPSLANGLIGAVPGHPIIKECLSQASRSSDTHNFADIMNMTGPFMFTNVYNKLMDACPESVVFPVSYFYPYPNAERYKCLGNNHENYIRPETVCVHQWHCSWMKSNKKPGMIKKLKMKFLYSKLKWYLDVLNCGLDIDFRGILRRARAFPQFYRQLQAFKKSTNWPIQIEPRLGDRTAQAGALGEYFWQDLFVAKRILEIAPTRHVDVGSRIDGFVAHLACSRTLDIIDIRPLSEVIPGVAFHQVDITNLPEKWKKSADCVTCLHTIEHFGLGRYGDPIDADGWKSGLKNLAGIVQPGGRLILSTPVGSQRIKFNSHRIFDPATIADFASTIGFKMERFAYHTYGHGPESSIVVSKSITEDFIKLASIKYSVGIFEFSKSE